MSKNMKIPLDVEIEKAIRLLAKFMLQSKADSKKSPLFHDVRVGMYLYQKGYSRDIVLAGFLHDALEHSAAKEEDIKKKFGGKVLELVKANTKDYSIEDSWKRVEELTKRAADYGEDAFIVRVIDTIDNFKIYSKSQNKSELDYCRKNAEEIFKNLPAGTDDPVFEELRDASN